MRPKVRQRLLTICGFGETKSCGWSTRTFLSRQGLEVSPHLCLHPLHLKVRIQICATPQPEALAAMQTATLITAV